MKPSTNIREMAIRVQQQIHKSVNIKEKKEQSEEAKYTIIILSEFSLIELLNFWSEHFINLFPSDTKKRKKL